MRVWTIPAIFGAVVLAMAACGGREPTEPTATQAPVITAAPRAQETTEPAVTDTDTTTLTTAVPTPTFLQTPKPTPRTPLSLAGSIIDSSLWLRPADLQQFSSHDRDEAPVASLITVSAPNAEGIVNITGAAGAVPGITRQTHKDLLRIAAIDWGSETCIQFSPDGSFSTQLAAGPGNTILLAAVFDNSCKGGWFDSTASAVLRVPEGVDYWAPSKPFSISGFNNAWHWFASGELLGSDPHIEFTIPDGQHEGCIVPRLYVYRLFDAAGEYAGQVNLNVHGPVMTPTGLPIETDQGLLGYWAVVTPSVPGKPMTQQCLNSNARYELRDWMSVLEPGWYRPRVVFHLVNPDGSDFLDLGWQSSDFDGGLERNTGIGYLPLVRMGNAQMPRIPATLLNESASWGSGGIRGIVAREDERRFALGSRRAGQGPFIASPKDPLSGRPITYMLEPFFPMIAYTGFGEAQPQIPLIPLDESALGALSASLTKPDGDVITLAVEAPILQSFISGGVANAYPVLLSFAGPARTYGVTTGKDSLEVEFDQYGLHTVSITGVVRTLRGQELRIEGTYDIWVAEPLDLSLGTFEGTPLEVGQEWSPVVVVEPGVPAEVEVRIDHYVNGDPAKRESL